MKIKVLARSFFEARQGTERERRLFLNYRIISINSVSFPAEPPPFSAHLLDAPNLLVLFFDDVDSGFSHAMTRVDAERIAEFALHPDLRPLLIHCTAGISRSGAVGEVLNWYYNRVERDAPGAFQRFARDNPDIVPNSHVRRLLLEALEIRPATGEITWRI